MPGRTPPTRRDVADLVDARPARITGAHTVGVELTRRVGGVVVFAAGGTGADVAGSLLVLAGVIVAIGGAVFGGATRGVFGVALYRYVAEDNALGPFTAPELATAARTT